MMDKTAKELTVSDLERLLSAKQNQIEQLTAKRDAAAALLADLNSEIAALTGKTVVVAVKGKKAAPMKKRGKKAGKKSSMRPKNAKPLASYVTDVLTREKKGLPIDELAKAVLASGYKTTSEKFKNTLYQCLYKSEDIGHDKKTGFYSLR